MSDDSDLRGFSRRMQVLGDLVAVNADRLVRRTALAVDGSVVIATPVDTGRARSNWIVEIDSPATAQRPAYHPGIEGSTSGPNAQAAIDQGAGAIAGYNGDRNTAIHITNNLDYIRRLNDGWSAQAPKGFVEIAVLDGVQQIRGATLLVRSGGKTRVFNGGSYG